MKKTVYNSIIVSLLWVNLFWGTQIPMSMQASAAGNVQADTKPGGRDSVHGMVVFGRPDSGVYMSHIPMYQAPHDMQAFFEVSLPGKRNFHDGLYTFEPKAFSLDDLLTGQLDTMQGTLYQGNFEAGGTPLQDLTVHVNRVLEAKQLHENATQEPVLEYRVLGTPKDAYLIHPISKAPNFDQIAHIDLSHSTLSEADIKASVHLILPGRTDDIAHRISEGLVDAEVEGTDRKVKVAIDKVLSTLVGPMFTKAP